MSCSSRLTPSLLKDCASFHHDDAARFCILGSYLTVQWVDDETPDNCVDNLIEGNVITNGIECVDIKEGSTGNIVQGNFCSDQIDKKSGCFNIRGDDNTIRRDGFRKTLLVESF